MVLKKSNSPFNTGTTQRLCNRGAYQRRYSGNRNVRLSITLEMIPRVYEPLNPSTTHIKALNKIYDYLQFDGPAYEDFYNLRARFMPSTMKRIELSSNTKDFWDLPEKIDRLMADDTFLKDEDDVAEVHVYKNVNLINTNNVYKVESKIFQGAATEISQPSLGNVDKIRKRKKKSRGVQRRHLLHIASNRENDIDRPHVDARKKVTIRLEARGHYDARTVKSPGSVYHMFKKKGKSLCKAKGCVNGKDSIFMKGYDPCQIKLNNNTRAFHDVVDYDCSYFSNTDENEESNDIIEENCYTCHQERFINLKEYLALPKKRRRCEKKTNGVAKEVSRKTMALLQGEYVNTASSQTTIKNQKGSFEIIENPFVSDHSNNDKIIGRDFVMIDADDKQDTNNNKISSTLSEFSFNTELISVLETFSSQDNFVTINLNLCEDFLGVIYSNEYRFYVKQCPVLFGNCFPPVFCVELEKQNLRINREWSICAISQSNLTEANDSKWRVKLKCTQLSNEIENVKNLIILHLKSIENTAISLEHLVEIVSTIIQNNYDKTVDHGHGYNSKDNEGNVDKKNNYNSAIPCNTETSYSNYRIVDSCHAFKEINMPGDSHSHNTIFSTQIKLQDGYQKLDITKVNSECDICYTCCDKFGAVEDALFTLLPCNHTFCYHCWQSHIVYHAKSGDLAIKCMHTDCQQVLNKTVLFAFIPDKDMNIYILQQNERKIDENPRCKWCPRTTCNKIALIHDHYNLKSIQNFGCSVVCECGSPWCFSCQSQPHFPASCSQAAVFRKLLAKLNYTVPKSITHNVQLKPCPGCKYPIEKNEGCPQMSCIMCHQSFCWKCLRLANTHTIWACTADENSNFSTYQLNNEVVNNFPLKYMSQSTEFMKKHNAFKRHNLLKWLNATLIINKGCIDNKLSRQKTKHSFFRSLYDEDSIVLKQKTISIVMESVKFLSDCFLFLEYFYLLMSFAELNKTELKDKRTVVSVTALEYKSKRLAFIVSRLQEIVSVKNVNRLVISEQSCQMFLDSGREIYNSLKQQVPALQIRSLGVNATPYGDLDPTKYFTYH